MGFSLKKLAKGALKIATGDVIGGIGSIAGGVIGSKGSKKAAGAQAEGMQQGINYLQGASDQNRADFQPYQAAGTAALNRLSDPSAFEASQGFLFARDQGLDAIKTQQNSLGRLASGNTLAALTQFGTGLAQQDYNNWWNQQNQLAGMGLNATGNMASLNAGNAGSIANLLSGQGAARADGIVGSTNAWGNALTGVMGALDGSGMAPTGPGGSGGGIAPNKAGLAGLNIAPNAIKQAPRNLLSYRG
jgi:hypothetical protein